MTISARNFNYPNPIKYGAGRIKELADHCAAAGIKRPLFVTDPGLAGMPMTQDVIVDVARNGLKIEVFSDVRPNPVEANINEGVEAFKAGKHDGVIAFGGGSALDVGKMIALMHSQVVSLWELEDIGDWWTRADASVISPVIAVPTTAGTGSEVGRASVITHPVTHEKKIIFHPGIMPKVAILDPELTVGLPPKLTAATGMDAFAHNLEAYCAPFYHPMADGIALEGMRLALGNLAQASKKGKDLQARGNMLMASAMGATAFQKGLGSIHSLSHPFGGLYDAHHGLLNGIIMPYVLNANARKIADKMDRASAYLGIKGGFDGFRKTVLKLRKEIGIPHSLSEIGINTKRLDEVAKMAVKDPTAGANPILFTEKQYKSLAKKCVVGEL